MKSVVGMSNISAMMSTISVRTSTSTSTSPLPAGSSGELEHLESSAGIIHCAWSRHYNIIPGYSSSWTRAFFNICKNPAPASGEML